MIANLQVLRGLAALGVVLVHTHFALDDGVATELQAVSVFFVISGFIMTYITREDSGQFLTQRIIRIVPLYWLCTLIMIAAACFKGSGRAWSDGTIENIAKSLFFIPYRDAVGNVYPLLLVGWTLNIEMLFYALFALSLAVSRRWAPLLTCAALISAKIVHRELGCSALLCEFYAQDYTDFLVAGIASYYVWKALDPHALDHRSIVAALGFVVVVIFLTWNLHPPSAAAMQKWLPFLGYLMPPMLVTSMLLLHSARFRWRWRLALLLGDASYALYLTHTIVLEIYRAGRIGFASDQIAILDPEKSVYALFAMLTACSLVAIVVHRRIELPILGGLRNRLVRRSNAGAPVDRIATRAELTMAPPLRGSGAPP
jgi:exopolysaccharide production protein ExoZ